MSTTYTSTQSFTRTDAKYLASKVRADLTRMRRFYGSPTESRINEYEIEVIELLAEGYLGKVSYGFKRDGRWIEPSLHYRVSDLIASPANDDPGGLTASADISGASFYSFLEYSQKYLNLSTQEQERFENRLPFKRGTADEPGVDGYLVADRTYSSSGTSLARQSVKRY